MDLKIGDEIDVVDGGDAYPARVVEEGTTGGFAAGWYSFNLEPVHACVYCYTPVHIGAECPGCGSM